MLCVDKLSHSFTPDMPVLSDISFSVGEGEVVALLGASGCGKSTLLKLIAGLIHISEGKCEVNPNANMAFVFQEPSLMPWCTVTDNVALPLKLKQLALQSKVVEALQAVEMQAFAARYPAQLSGGQKMRVSIARALVSEPKLLLLDEPFAALDEILRFRMNELVLELRDRLGLATIFVTHSIYEAAFLADRVLVMAGGKLVGVIKPDLDRSVLPAEQRISKRYLNTVQEISRVLAGLSYA